MSNRLVIFGVGNIAELAHFYFSRHTDYQVVAFVVDASHLTTTEFCGLPVTPFEEALQRFPPDTHDFFIAVSYSRLNALRREKYLAARARGYRMASYISPLATVLNDGRIGDNCFILENNVIQPFAEIGSNVTLWSGNHIGHHARIDDHCFIASHVVVSGGVEIGDSCFVGVNATIRDHVKIGASSVIGAGVTILCDVEPQGVYASTESERSRILSSRLRKI